MIHINDVTYRLGDRLLLDKATAAIPDGARVGFIGRNGTGKTTLFKIITGDLGLETGGVQLPKLARIGKVEQEAPGGPDSLLDFVLRADTERDALLAEAERASDPNRIAEIQTRLVDIGAHAAPARAAAILSGLGFDAAAQARPCSDFSGGWRMRVALAAVLFLEPDLLLLDEPTNYLDLEGTVWLQNYLARYPHTTVTISHDRDFLDSVADHILHLEQGKLSIYRGNYAGFARQYAEKKLAAQRAIERQMAERRHMEAFVERFRAKASKAKQAQSRLKRLARMQEIAVPPDDDEPELHLPSPEKPLAPPLIAFDNVSVGYGERVVLRRINTSIGTDERIGLLGSNGNGKSTLVKLIAGRLPAMDGTLKRAGRFDVGYFAQHQLDELDGTMSPYQVMRARLAKSPFPLPPEAQIRSKVAALGFGADKADRKFPASPAAKRPVCCLVLRLLTSRHALSWTNQPTISISACARR
jgi:ATP-binding cassette, subfamily F, member 3